MQARDIMTEDVVTVAADTPIQQVVDLMLSRHISAMPVVDADGRILGIVSEGDLMNRPEAGTRHRARSWWLRLLESPGEQATDFLKVYGGTAGEVMSRQVITAGEDDDVAAIASLLEKHRIKRVPIVRDGRLVGIVSRANLLRCFGQVARQQAAPADASEVRSRIHARLAEAGMHGNWVNVIVNDANIELWGAVESSEQIAAAQAAARAEGGGRQVLNHLSMLDRRAISGYGGV